MISYGSVLTAVSTLQTSKRVTKTFLVVLVSFENNDCATQEAASHGRGVSLCSLVVVILFDLTM